MWHSKKGFTLWLSLQTFHWKGVPTHFLFLEPKSGLKSCKHFKLSYKRLSMVTKTSFFLPFLEVYSVDNLRYEAHLLLRLNLQIHQTLPQENLEI